jgi:hypothetical protein
MSTGSTTPDVAAQQIRYALSQLRSRNAHHQFEDLCRYFAIQRISRNILPATGPVSAGGDQGRDFETFRTYISGHFLHSFLAVENTLPVVFTCTLQTDGLAAKIKADVALIAAGSRVEAVYFFSEADIPVGKRHELISWAAEEHSLYLEVFDGTALAELLAQPSIFWIAERILALPSSLRPSRMAHAQPDIQQLLARPGSLRLPEWPGGWDEAHYNSFVTCADPRFLLLDRFTMRIPDGNGRFEACDLLGPDDELIHIGRPNHSGAFGRLFNQAMISAEILVSSAKARKELSDIVLACGAGRVLQPHFHPREVIVAFPSGTGPVVPVKRIPEFSHMMLARVAETIEDLGVTLRVVGIGDADGAD